MSFPSSSAGPDLCVVVPTFNESANVTVLVNRLREALAGLNWEAIFVDDNSPDGTADVVNAMGQQDFRVRVIRRFWRRGLSSAVVEGMLATTAPYIAVIDADLQHDEALLPRMRELLVQGGCDVVVASRMVEGGGSDQMSPLRQRISQFSSKLARSVIRTDVNDLMSGFFMVRREVAHETAPRLSAIGFKILADLLASSVRPLRVVEVPYHFRARQAGESKLDAQAASAFILLLIDKKVGHWLPARLLAFLAVGSTGVLVHFAALWLFYSVAGAAFGFAQALATLLAITSNFALNNAFTYSDLRLKGWQWLRGWASFFLVSAIGAIGNVGVASVLFNHAVDWKLSAIAGIVIGVIWNFTMTRAYTWHAGER